MFDRLTPQLLEMAMARIGLFAGQFKDIDADAKKALIRFILTAAESGNANAYIKSRLAVIDAYDQDADEHGDRPPPVEGKARVTSPPGGVP